MRQKSKGLGLFEFERKNWVRRSLQIRHSLSHNRTFFVSSLVIRKPQETEEFRPQLKIPTGQSSSTDQSIHQIKIKPFRIPLQVFREIKTQCEASLS
jgi:hypothetical protein